MSAAAEHLQEQVRLEDVIDDLTLDELHAEHDRRLVAILKIKEQIYRARAERADTGEYADRDWFRRATKALRWNQRDAQLLQATMGARNRKRRASFEQAFFDAARRRLDPTTFAALIDDAHAASEACETNASRQ